MTPHKFFKYPSIIALLLGLISLSACFNSTQTQPTNDELDAQPVIPGSNINLAKPLDISQKPADLALAKKINDTIDQSEFANARWGAITISLKDGRIVFARDAQKLFNPASIEKLITSTVALDTLGAGFRWKTSVFATKQLENDTLNGDLILYGTGAPDFSDESLNDLVNQLKQKGLKHIKGSIAGDESYFTGDKIGDGWTWNELQWYYGAEASALTFNENQSEITLKNGQPVSSNPDIGTIHGTVKPTKDIEAIGLKREISENDVYIWGSGGNLQTRISVSKPAFWAAQRLSEKLEKNGVIIDGETKFVDWKTDNRFEVSGGIEIASILSGQLGDIVHRMNKDSVNLYAELILRTLGKKFGDSAPDQNPKIQKLRGDDSAGASFIKKWLIEKKIANDEIEIHDGSGLSRLTFVSPEVLGKTIIFASQAGYGEVFRSSLPIAGIDGTMRGRMKNQSGRVLAKTGSMTYVNSLAGFARSKDDTYVFAIITNAQTHNNDASPLIDSIASLLIE